MKQRDSFALTGYSGDTGHVLRGNSRFANGSALRRSFRSVRNHNLSGHGSEQSSRRNRQRAFPKRQEAIVPVPVGRLEAAGWTEVGRRYSTELEAILDAVKRPS